MPTSLAIWTNAKDVLSADRPLLPDLGEYRLLTAPDELAHADIAYGQPDPEVIIANPRIKWVEVSSAGYTKYETPEFLDAMKARSGMFTTSSSVYDEPVAQHALAMMLAFSRQLPDSMQNQLGPRAWPTGPTRREMFLLKGQVVSIYGFGSIARKLVAMLAPFHMTIRGARRNPAPYPGVSVMTTVQLDEYLGDADHVVNILPANTQTEEFFNAERIHRMKKSAFYYNLGRGSTTDQLVLRTALETQRIAGAYLDVTTPEPLPPDDPIWHIPNLYVTPHTAGGHGDEFASLARHFTDNLRRYLKGEPLRDRIV